MIKINLIPGEVKKDQKLKSSFEFKSLNLAPKLLKPALYLLSILIGLHLLLTVSILAKAASLKKLNSKWQHLGPSKTEVDRVNSEIANIEKTMSPMRQLVEKRTLWAKELNELSNSMSTGIWLNKLFINTQAQDAKKDEYVRVLNLEGCVASLYGDETALVARFVKALQGNKEFFQYFSELKLGPMERSALEKIPTMNFKIFCFFKKRN